MTGQGFAYIPPSSQPKYPLERFLPLWGHGALTDHLAARVEPGAWLVDPLGVHPGLALEAAQAGYRVLVASNNPIVTFMLETLASAPHADDFNAALADLSFQKIGAERLDVHLAGLYQTECPQCRQDIPAEAFICQRGSPAPYARLITCPRCGFQGEASITDADIALLEQFSNDALHRSRALERVSPAEGEARLAIAEALTTYTPRNLYFLSTLINRLFGPGWDARRKQLLSALILSAADAGVSLWAYPDERSRPRQLSIPPTFRENNLWLALERGITDWSLITQPIEVTQFPALPDGPGICLYPGRLKTIPPLPKTIQPQLAVVLVPRPAQAVWTLSALWSGWLWGQDAVTPLHASLGRQNYDWYWLTGALSATLTRLREMLPHLPVLAFAPELAPGFLLAGLAGPTAAGFTLDGIAAQMETDTAQLLWQPAQSALATAPGRKLDDALRTGIEDVLRQQSQPATHELLITAAMSSCATSNALPTTPSGVMPDLFTRIQSGMASILKDHTFLTHYPASSGGELAGWWHLRHPPSDLPFLDRVEQAIINHLVHHSPTSRRDMILMVNRAFPSLTTPPESWLEACLESYGESDDGLWSLRENEQPDCRRKDTNEMKAMLLTLGRHLDFEAEGDDLVIWMKDIQSIWSFQIITSSIVYPYVLNTTSDKAAHHALVLPGSRARLLTIKRRLNPELNCSMDDWYVIKYRTIRQMAAIPDLTYAMWEALIDNDPPMMEDSQQLAIF